MFNGFRKGLPPGYSIKQREDSAGSIRGEIYLNGEQVAEEYSLYFWVWNARNAKAKAWKHYKAQRILGNA